MTIGIGGSTAAIELEKIENRTQNVQPILLEEYLERIQKAVLLMKELSVKALYLNAGTNLYYFTGTLWNASERMVGAVLFDDGSLEYIVPKFEEGTFKKYMKVESTINCWEEHESPYVLFGKLLVHKKLEKGTIAIDESSSYFLVDGIAKANSGYDFVTAQNITAACRMQNLKMKLRLFKKQKTLRWKCNALPLKY